MRPQNSRERCDVPTSFDQLRHKGFGDVLAAAHIRYEIGNLTQILARFRRKPQTAGHAAALPARRRSRFSRTCAKTSSPVWRSEAHTSELQSLMRNSYAVLCFTTKKT